MKPREFKLIVEAWQTRALSWDENNLNELTTGEIIHTREITPADEAKDKIFSQALALLKSAKEGFAIEGYEDSVIHDRLDRFLKLHGEPEGNN